MDDKVTFQDIKDYHRRFTKERKWEAFHDPKSVAMSIAIEAAELMEIFQWTNAEESFALKNNEKECTHIKEELSDVIMYCMSMANIMDIDVSEALADKIKKNEAKYPKDDNRYTELIDENGNVRGR